LFITEKFFRLLDSEIVIHRKYGEISTNLSLLQDERGTAAIKTVEIDDSFGGVPVQYREVLSSTRIISLFSLHVYKGTESRWMKFNDSAAVTVSEMCAYFRCKIMNLRYFCRTSKMVSSEYLKGGAESGFRPVKDQYENWKPRLFHCKGKRNVRCTEVECNWKELNLGDVFILDCGLQIYVWMPPESGRLERIKVSSFHFFRPLVNSAILDSRSS
uniref:Gelsolin-like protein 1 (inferred by orthology to a C. elegans protein) n=1 Tax=Anisakis simplex TaxID=6269 RepID=A0A0M3J1T8_ANISI